MKQKYSALMISICGLMILSLITGATYALWIKTFKQTDENVVETGCFNIAFNDGTSIKLTNTYPMSDAAGLAKNPYNFSIENTCTVYGEYYITLDIVDANTNIDLSKVKVALDGPDFLAPTILSTLTTRALNSSDTSTYRTSYILAKGMLSDGSKNEYNLKIWIDESADNTIANKKLEARLTITTVATKPITLAETIEKSSTNNTLGANCLYDKTSDSDQYFIEGDNTCNNYVWYSGKLWRIVSTDPADGSVKLITQDSVTGLPFRDKDTVSFSNSYMDQWLREVFEPTLYNKDTLIIDKDFNATANTTSNKPDNTTLVNRTVGLLNSYEYEMSHKNTNSLNGFLNIGQVWWLANPYDTTTLRNVGELGELNFSSAHLGYTVRPVINISSDININGGVGTETNPYKINDDISPATNGELLNKRISGEYVKFNDQLFRIVAIEGNLTKINSYDYLRIVEDFSSIGNEIFDPTSTTSELVYYLNTKSTGYYQTLNTAYKNMIADGTWNLGELEFFSPDWHHTTDTSSTCNRKGICTVSAKVGLPRASEIWTNMNSAYIHELLGYFTLTPYSSAGFVRYVNHTGELMNNNVGGSVDNTRVSMYLHDNVKIIGGLGTKELPFEIAQ